MQAKKILLTSIAAIVMAVPAAAQQKSHVFGKIYPQRLDDLAWENEWCAFRAYGPALQQKNQKLYGYDIWVKNTHDTIVDLRYRLHFPPKGVAWKSFHKDWGNGMDNYDVDSSLGCCTAALLDKNDSIIFPWCWKTCDISENGPDVFKAHLTYDNGEHRIISCKKGERLNRCEVWYEGLKEPRRIAVGIVEHDTNLDTLAMDKKHHFIAYVDLQNQKQVAKDGSDGVIYIGAYVPQATEYKTYTDLNTNVKHLLAISTIKPGQHFVYYFGATWSKFDVHSFKQWKEIMSKQKPW